MTKISIAILYAVVCAMLALVGHKVFGTSTLEGQILVMLPIGLIIWYVCAIATQKN